MNRTKHIIQFMVPLKFHENFDGLNKMNELLLFDVIHMFLTFADLYFRFSGIFQTSKS